MSTPRSCAPIRTRRARPKKGPQEFGRSRGDPSTKIHALVDALGNPDRIILSPGQRHDIKLADKLLDGIHDAYVAADRAYDAKALVQMLEANRCTVVIPSNPTRAVQREIDLHLYKERHLIECFFQRLKRFRRIAMRFEKLARNFLAFVHLACVLIWSA